MSLIAPFIKEIFKGLKPSWKKLFLSPEFKSILNKCFKKINADLVQKGVTAELIQENGIESYIRPVPSKILHAFKYFEVSETRVIIIGQDPYTKVDEAEGLSFSVPVGTRVPPSLRTIYQALESQKLITKIPNHGNLSKWAQQGILLLNRYLTRTPTIVLDDTGTAYVKNDGGSTKNNMHPFWTDFTNAVVKYIADINPNIILLLWGKKAEEVCEAVAEKVAAQAIDIQIWGHPSPLNTSSNFGKCPHFKYVNEKLREKKLPEIDWNIPEVHIKGTKKITADAQVAIIEELVHERIVVFTDGGCPKNGKKDAKAVYAAYFPKTFDGKPNGISGEYSGVVPDKEINPNGKVFDGEKVTPTNNRGELLGIITALSVILQEYKTSKKKRSVLLVTDSEICMGTINAWVWKWMKSTKKEKKNMDLVAVLYKLLVELSEAVPTDKLLQASAETDCKNNNAMDLQWGGLTVIHQNSHLAKKDIPKKGTREYELYAGNQRADDLCNTELAK